jgi:hypothetical protein
VIIHRHDPDEARRARQRAQKRARRADPTYREQEKAKQRAYARQRRLDPEFREKEREDDRLRKRELRRAPAYQARESAPQSKQRPCHACTNHDDFRDAALRRAAWRRELAELRRKGLAPPATYEDT